MSSFAAGFFGQLNNDITNQKQYIRARVDEDRTYLREQGLKRQAGIQEQRGAYERAATSLIRRGADERTVLGTLEMDPQGLMMVYSDTKDDNRITGNNLNDMMSIAADYRSEASMEEILTSILPTAQEMPNDTDPVTSRRRSIGSWLGLNVDEALSNEVYNQQIVGGMTGDQIMASMNLPIQAQGSNEGGVTYDFTAPVSAEPMRAADFNAHMATANSDYDLESMVLEIDEAINSAKVDNADVSTEEGVARVAELESTKAGLMAADSLNGVLRLNAILELGITPGPNTVMLRDSLGTSLFNSESGSTAATLNVLLGNSGEDTSDAAINASGVPGGSAVDPSGVSANPAGTPLALTEETVRPRSRPSTLTANTPEEAGLIAEGIFADTEVDRVEIILRGEPIIVTRKQVPPLSIEESDDRASLTAAFNGNDQGILDDELISFTEKYGLEMARAHIKSIPSQPDVNPDDQTLIEALESETTPVTLGTNVSGMRPRSRPGQEPLAVLEGAVSSMRPRSRPDQLGQTDQRPESAVLSAVITGIEDINSPEFEEVFTALLREEDLNVRDEMVTSAVGILRTLETVPENVETLLLLLDTFRQPVRRNPLTGPGRAPTQPTLWQAPNEDRNDPVSIPADKNFDDDFNRVAPVGPGSGLDELVSIYYDTLVNQDARGGPPSPARSLEGSGVNQLVNSYYDLLVNEDIRRNSSNTR